MLYFLTSTCNRHNLYHFVERNGSFLNHTHAWSHQLRRVKQKNIFPVLFCVFWPISKPYTKIFQRCSNWTFAYAQLTANFKVGQVGFFHANDLPFCFKRNTFQSHFFAIFAIFVIGCNATHFWTGPLNTRKNETAQLREEILVNLFKKNRTSKPLDWNLLLQINASALKLKL